MKTNLVRRILLPTAAAAAILLVGPLNGDVIEPVQQALYWLADSKGPEINAVLPQGYVHGRLKVNVALKDESGAWVKSLAVDGKQFSDDHNLELDTARLPDGEHVLVVEAIDWSLRKNTSQKTFSFRTDNTPPNLASQLEPSQAGQGQTLAVRISPSESVTLTASLGGQSLSFLPKENGYWSVIGFAPDSSIGGRTLEISAVDKAGLQTTMKVPIWVTRLNYPTESLYIPEDRAGLLSPAIVDAEIEYLTKVFATFTPEKLWSGLFMTPVQGVTSSPFAVRRSYNGGPLGSHHGGIDFAVGEGTPAPAANRGRVAVAEALKVRGNVVIIDHGMGVYSGYFHLSQIKVQKGQAIEKGQVIGLVGNTGLSTGAHLHWEMRVTGAAVDPLEWTTREFP